MMALVAPLVPIVAAAFQSAWIVLVRGTHTYQAMLYPYQPSFTESTGFWLGNHVLLYQVLISVAVLWPLVRFPEIHRFLALLVFAVCLYYDCCVITRSVIH
jgi:hypothetical protein